MNPNQDLSPSREKNIFAGDMVFYATVSIISLLLYAFIGGTVMAYVGFGAATSLLTSIVAKMKFARYLKGRR